MADASRAAAPLTLEAEMAACQDCGACCAGGFDCVEVEPDEPFARLHPTLLRADFGVLQLPRPGGRCPCLTGERPALSCVAYAVRPRSCADFPVGEDSCDQARARIGLSPLPRVNSG